MTLKPWREVIMPHGDANDWATETMNDPRYPLSLLLRVINVSLKTVAIVNALPALEIHDAG